MSKIKTLANDSSVEVFIDKIEDENKKQDSIKLIEVYESVTGHPAIMWGTSIIGFDSYHYKSERSSQEGDWPIVGFSPRKANLTLYFMHGFNERSDLLNSLGKHKLSKSCLYIKKLSDVDMNILKELIKLEYKEMKRKYS